MAKCTISSPAVEGELRLIEDCTALLTARDVLDPSGSQLNWSVDRPMTDWDGVQILEGKVTTLLLKEKQLGGSIPSQLEGLTHLKNLNLSGNDLTGSIPSELGNFNLKKLCLHRNNLVGCIPESVNLQLGKRPKSDYIINPQKGEDLPVCRPNARHWLVRWLRG